MIMGEKDRIAPFDWQKRSIELARKLLQTDASKAKVDKLVRTQPGADNTELVTYIHPGGHEFPVDAMSHIVKFFQRHQRK
jgi:polyhydroxybutyrate depolymerase